MKQTAGVVVGMALIGVLTACSVDVELDPETRRTVSPHPTAPSSPMHVDYRHDDVGLRDLAAMADLVVFGTVEAVETGVQVGPDPQVISAVVTVRVEEVLRGEPEGPVKVALLTGVHGKSFALPGQAVPGVGTHGIWMLTKIGPQFAIEGYHPSSLSGEILFDAAGRVVTDDAGGSDLPRGRQEAEQLGTLEKVLERLSG